MDEEIFRRLSEIYPALNNNLEFINSFTLLWNVFESQISTVRFHINYKGFDSFVNKGNLSDFDSSTFVEFWRTKGDYDFLNQYLSIDRRIGGNSRHYLTTIKRVLNQDGSLTSDEINFSSLCISYRIRNNMFHGAKNILDLENQRDIFQMTNNYLMDLIENLNSRNLIPYS